MFESSTLVQSTLALLLAAALSIGAVSARVAFDGRWSTATDSLVLAFVLTPLFAKFFLLLLLPGVGFSALPLHVCDIAGAFCAIGIATRHPDYATLGTLTSILYSSVAIFQPDLGDGSSLVEHVLFWTRHISLAVAAVYLMFGLGLLPTRRGYWKWVAFVLGYVALAIPTNSTFGTNFAYLANISVAPRILELLGPWPYRLVPMIAIPLVLGAAITEWSVRSRLSEKLASSTSRSPS